MSDREEVELTELEARWLAELRKKMPVEVLRRDDLGIHMQSVVDVGCSIYFYLDDVKDRIVVEDIG